MQILTAVLVAAVAILQSWPLSSPHSARSDPVLVRHVVDGDTIDVVNVGRVRLLGIDAPELAHGYDTPAPWAQEARDRLTTLVLNKWVRLETDGQPLDVYRRRLAYVLTDAGTFVNAVLLRDGLAHVTTRVPLLRLEELRRAESEAQALRRGMWGGAPQIPSPGYTRPSDGTRSPAPKRKQPAQHVKKSKKNPSQ